MQMLLLEGQLRHSKVHVQQLENDRNLSRRESGAEVDRLRRLLAAQAAEMREQKQRMRELEQQVPMLQGPGCMCCLFRPLLAKAQLLPVSATVCPSCLGMCCRFGTLCAQAELCLALITLAPLKFGKL